MKAVRNRNRRSEAGTALLEFALSCSILFALTAGICDLGLNLYRRVAVNNLVDQVLKEIALIDSTTQECTTIASDAGSLIEDIIRSRIGPSHTIVINTTVIDNYSKFQNVSRFQTVLVDGKITLADTISLGFLGLSTFNVRGQATLETYCNEM